MSYITMCTRSLNDKQSDYFPGVFEVLLLCFSVVSYPSAIECAVRMGTRLLST